MRATRFGTIICIWLAVARPATAQDSVLALDFSHPQAMSRLTKMPARGIRCVEDDTEGRCLQIVLPAESGPSSVNARCPLPIDQLKGTRVRVDARVRARNVSRPAHDWNGIKCMLHVTGPAGDSWRQQNRLWGSFDWRTLHFTAEIPRDATGVELILGLEQTSGTAWLNDVRVQLIGRQRRRPPRPAAGPVFRGTTVPRLRGAMIGPRTGPDDLQVLGGKWQANHIRWQLIWGGFPHGPADRASVSEYHQWLASQLQRLDRLIPVCRQLGMGILIDVHTPPGGRNEQNECRMFQLTEFQAAFVRNWQEIARRYRDQSVIWGYDLVNEPVEAVVAPGLLDWHTLATRTAQAIRDIDASHAIIVEPAPWGSPSSLDWFEPIPVARLVYSVHMYQPHAFTHQGVRGTPRGARYPGPIEGKMWNRAALVDALQPAIDYQLDYGVQIYIGEFSAIRWAPDGSAYRYLSDCIDIFEQHRWDWAYHAFREWDGWSVEHGPDPANHQPTITPTDRERLLRKWYQTNQRF